MVWCGYILLKKREVGQSKDSFCMRCFEFLLELTWDLWWKLEEINYGQGNRYKYYLMGHHKDLATEGRLEYAQVERSLTLK